MQHRKFCAAVHTGTASSTLGRGVDRATSFSAEVKER